MAIRTRYKQKWEWTSIREVRMFVFRLWPIAPQWYQMRSLPFWLCRWPEGQRGLDSFQWRGGDCIWGGLFLILVIFCMHNKWGEAQVYISYENRGQSFWVRMKNWVACEGWTPASQMVCFQIFLPSVFRKLSEKGSDGPGAGVCEICFHRRQLIHITMQKIIRVFPICSSQPQKSKESKAGNPTFTQYSELMLPRGKQGKQVVQIFRTGLKTIYPRDGSGATAQKYSCRKIRLGKKALYFP